LGPVLVQVLLQRRRLLGAFGGPARCAVVEGPVSLRGSFQRGEFRGGGRGGARRFGAQRAACVHLPPHGQGLLRDGNGLPRRGLLRRRVLIGIDRNRQRFLCGFGRWLGHRIHEGFVSVQIPSCRGGVIAACHRSAQGRRRLRFRDAWGAFRCRRCRCAALGQPVARGQRIIRPHGSALRRGIFNRTRSVHGLRRRLRRGGTRCSS